MARLAVRFSSAGGRMSECIVTTSHIPVSGLVDVAVRRVGGSCSSLVLHRSVQRIFIRTATLSRYLAEYVGLSQATVTEPWKRCCWTTTFASKRA